MIAREAKGYRSESQPPADAMWSRIELDVARAIKRKPGVTGVTRYWPWLAAGAGIAAALVIGVALGRRGALGRPDTAHVATVNTAGTSASFATISADSLRSLQTRVATLNHLAQVEVFLTEVRADLRTGRNTADRDDRSRSLLTRTRLLMANDAGQAPAVERLLQDLELVLAEIAVLPDSGGRGSVDVRLLKERLSAGTVLPRIRTILPASPSMGGI